MQLWTLKVFLSGQGRDLIKEWFDEQSPKVQAGFEVALQYLLQRPITHWKYPHYRRLTGEGEGLGEVRFFADKVQHRPIGFRGPEEMAFTLVLCAVEKGGRFVPRNALAISQQRKSEVLNDRRRARECDWL